MAEAAGLVLAVFPLIIEGLHEYEKGVRSIKRWRHYGNKILPDIIRRLSVQEMIFRDLCTSLLQDITDDQDTEPLLVDPGGTRWKEPQLSESLQDRLGPSFDPFMKTITHMKDIIEEFKEVLGLNAECKVCRMSHVDLGRLYAGLHIAANLAGGYGSQASMETLEIELA